LIRKQSSFSGLADEQISAAVTDRPDQSGVTYDERRVERNLLASP